MIFRVVYGAANAPLLVNPSYAQNQLSGGAPLRLGVVFNEQASGYVVINSATDTTLNITCGFGFQVTVAIYGYY